MLNLKVGPCPKCGNNTFNVTAHVTQTWLVTSSKLNPTATKLLIRPMLMTCLLVPSVGPRSLRSMFPANNFAKTFAKTFARSIVKKPRWGNCLLPHSKRNGVYCYDQNS